MTIVHCVDLGGNCGYEYTQCPLEVQPQSCIKMPEEEEEEDDEIGPPGGPG